LNKADLRIANLECPVSDIGEPRPKKYYNFRAPVSAIESLQIAGIDCVSLANNHAMDFGSDAILDTFKRLDSAGICHAGAGKSLADAMEPAILEADGMKISMVSVTDNAPGCEPGPGKPGLFNIPLWTPHIPDKFINSVFRWHEIMDQISSALSKARSLSDLAIFSAHIGPNNVERPSYILRKFAYDAIKEADIFHGHSAHTTQGIAIRQGKPILFDTGGFVDDYPPNPEYHSEWSFIHFLDFEDGRLEKIRLTSLEILDCQVNIAKGETAKKIFARAERLSKEMGTDSRIKDGQLIFQRQ
jgi:poly-gamma-glutamate synthesis protein (capsule biosynthesis protein)